MAEGAVIGTAILELATDSSKLDEGMTLGEQKARVFGKAAMLAIAGVTTAIAGVGAAALKLGQDFDEAFDTIRIGTGATGTALEELKNDFKAVVQDVPTDFATASQVIADLNTRTGQTGESLQALAKNVLELSRITGTEANANVAAATRLFGDWSVATDQQAATLDKVFRASQSTGIGVTELMQKVVQFGAPLRQMGFSLDESLAMLGKWEKEGVNTELVLGSLRIAAGNFAEAGIPLREGLQETIKTIANTTDASEALNIAIETFGARAGADMAAAIREGRFAIDDYVKAIQNGGDTILDVAGETADAGEKWQILMNQLSVAVEPFASGVLALATNFLDWLIPALEAVGTAIKPFTDAISSLGQYIAALISNDWQSIQDRFAALPEPLQTIAQPLKDVVDAFQTMADVLRALAGGDVEGAINTFFEGFGEQLEALGIDVATTQATVIQAFYVIRDVVITVLNEVVPFVQEMLDIVVSWVQENWPLIEATVRTVLNAVWTVIQMILNLIVVFWQNHGQQIISIVQSIWTIIKIVIETGIRTVLDIIKLVMQLITGDWQGAWENIQGIVGRIWEAIKIIVGESVNILQNLLSIAWDEITKGVRSAWEGIAGIISNVWLVIKRTIVESINQIIRSINDMIEDIEGTINTIVSFFGGERWSLPRLSELPIPSYAAGGIVPGPIGMPRLAIVHGGEEILTPEQRQSRAFIENFTYVANRTAEGEETVRDVLDSLTFRARLAGAL